MKGKLIGYLLLMFFASVLGYAMGNLGGNGFRAANWLSERARADGYAHGYQAGMQAAQHDALFGPKHKKEFSSQ